jgi:hypothetical protein
MTTVNDESGDDISDILWNASGSAYAEQRQRFAFAVGTGISSTHSRIQGIPSVGNELASESDLSGLVGLSADGMRFGRWCRPASFACTRSGQARF